jgi:hypothetical protein
VIPNGGLSEGRHCEEHPIPGLPEIGIINALVEQADVSATKAIQLCIGGPWIASLHSQ